MLSFLDEVLVFVFGTMIVSGAILIYNGRKRKPSILGEPNLLITEKITISTPTRAGWLYRLRTYPMTEKQKTDFWLIVVVLFIFGPVAIVIALSLPASTLLGANLSQRVTLVGFGIAVISTAVFLVANRIYVMRKSHQQLIAGRKTDDLALIDNFKRSFEAIQNAYQPKVREKRLGEFGDWLNAFCNKFEWDDEVGKLIFDVVQLIPLGFSDDPNVSHYLYYLNVIINSYGKQTIPTIKKKFLIDFEKMYDDPRFEINPQITSILMELHEYNEEYMMKIIEDAAYRWSDNRFGNLKSVFRPAFSMMYRRDVKVYCDFYKWLDDKWQDAERNRNESARSKLEELREAAKTYAFTSKGSGKQVQET